MLFLLLIFSSPRLFNIILLTLVFKSVLKASLTLTEIGLSAWKVSMKQRDLKGYSSES